MLGVRERLDVFGRSISVCDTLLLLNAQPWEARREGEKLRSMASNAAVPVSDATCNDPVMIGKTLMTLRRSNPFIDAPFLCPID